MLSQFHKSLYYVIFVVFFSLLSCSKENDNRLNIAVAANMQFAVSELVDVFSEQTGVLCEVIVGSSGKLTAQAMEGAPFDMFLSADIKYPLELYQKGIALEEPEVYALGKLIIWTLKKEIKPSFKIMEDARVSYIALGNPKTAPYGLAAIQVLNNLGLTEKLTEKLVFGESISQTNQFIISEVADIGFSSKSVVLSAQMKGKGAWKEVDENLYNPMEQGMVILTNRKKFRADALKFKDFILSTNGKQILKKFGYKVNL